MPELIRRYVRTGKVKVEARPIAFIGPDSQRGRAAALAAAKQNRLFNFSQLLYFNQGTENTGWLNDAMIKAAAASIPGLDVPRLLSDRKLAHGQRPGERVRLAGRSGQRHRDADGPRRKDGRPAAHGLRLADDSSRSRQRSRPRSARPGGSPSQ